MNTETSRQEWYRQSDDVAGYPFVVLYQDRDVFPPNRYFASKAAALEELNRDRPVQSISERKMSGKFPVARLIHGAYPKFGAVR